MATRQTKVALGPDVLSSLRGALDLPADASDAQLVRAAVLRFLGQRGADGMPVDRGGRRPRRTSATASNNPI